VGVGDGELNGVPTSTPEHQKRPAERPWKEREPAISGTQVTLMEKYRGGNDLPEQKTETGKKNRVYAQQGWDSKRSQKTGPVEGSQEKGREGPAKLKTRPESEFTQGGLLVAREIR